MEDFRTFTVVPNGFNYRQTIAENYRYKNQNNYLKSLVVLLSICILGVSVHLVNVELKRENNKKNKL